MDAYRERIREKVMRLRALAQRAGTSRLREIETAYNHACYLYDNEEVERAAEILHKLVSDAPERPATWQALGLAQFRLGQLAEAHASVTAGWMLYPEDPAPLYILGLIKQRQGCEEEARRLFQHTLALASQSPDYFDLEVKAAKQLGEV